MNETGSISEHHRRSPSSSGVRKIERGGRPVGPLLRRTWPLVLVFVASACVMVLELVAGRLIARHVGSSLYTWTSVIAVVLAGVALGNYVGGWLSDRRNERGSRSALSILLFLSAGSSLAVLWVHWWAFDVATSMDVSWPLRILIGVTMTFFVPSVTLGAVSPIVASVALRQAAHVGGTVGGLYAWGSIGAIVGTLATGFWLIPTFGTSVIVFIVASVLGSIGLAIAPSIRSTIAMGVLVGVSLSTAPTPVFGLSVAPPRDVTERPGSIYAVESPYQTITVTRDSGGRLTMMQDDLIHGYFDPGSPEYLDYPYLRLAAAAIDALPPIDGRIDALLLGGGAYTFPRYLLASYPSSRVLVAEIDEAVTRASEIAMFFDRDAGVEVIHADARIAVRDLVHAGERFDVVFSDAFRDVAVPHHLTTQEFMREVSHVVRPGGAFVANVIDVYADGRFLGAYVNTLRSVFDDVFVLATSTPTTALVRNTFVVVGSNGTLVRAEVLEAARRRVRTAQLLTAEQMTHLAERSGSLVLTDDFAPVDSLISVIPHLR